MTVSLVIQSGTGTFQGGTFQIGPLTIASAFSSLQVISQVYSGAQFFAIPGPAGAYGVIIEPPAANLVSLTLKGVSGDTGIPIGANVPTVIPFFNPSVSNTVGVTSAGAVTGVVTFTFF